MLIVCCAILLLLLFLLLLLLSDECLMLIMMLMKWRQMALTFQCLQIVMQTATRASNNDLLTLLAPLTPKTKPDHKQFIKMP